MSGGGQGAGGDAQRAERGRPWRPEAEAAGGTRARPEALADSLSQGLVSSPAWDEALVYIDQFAELFTVVDERYRKTFIAMLAATTRSDRVCLVLTLRADFYHRCVDSPDLAALLRTGSFPLAAPRIGTLHPMIVGPAARAGLAFEEGLPERILEDTGDKPGALALLAFALHALYEAQTGQGLLTRAAYERIGCVRGGSWSINQDYARCACRNHYAPVLRGGGSGFRLVCVSPIP